MRRNVWSGALLGVAAKLMLRFAEADRRAASDRACSPAPEAKPRPESWKTGYRSYAGWVPNIRSHLSFSLIGAAKDARSFTHPALDTPTRIVLALQTRVINDYPLPGWLALWAYPDIKSRWIMDAETARTKLPILRNGKLQSEEDRQGLLRGTVRQLPLQETDELEGDLRTKIDALAELLATPRQFDNAADVRGLRRQANELVEAAGSSIQLEFALMRTGECRIWFAEALPNVPEERHDWLAEQAYYFIKDMVHDHTHHDPTSDQITPLTLFDADQVEEGHEDEVKWRRETMWSLSREVERLNRSGKFIDQQRALGIVAYAEEFQDSLMSHIRDSSDPRGFRENTVVHDFDFEHLKASIKSVVDVRSTRLTQKIQRTIAVTALFVSTMALISSLVSTHNASVPRGPKGELSPELIKLGSVDSLLPWLAAEPILTAGGISLFVFAWLTFFAEEGSASLFNEGQRILSQFARAVAVSTTKSTRMARLLATVLNLFFALISALLCYVLLRLVAGGGTW